METENKATIYLIKTVIIKDEKVLEVLLAYMMDTI